MVDAGELRERVQLLTPDQEGNWRPLRWAWAKEEPGKTRTIFSSVGLSAKTELFTLRRQSVAPGDLLLWKGRHHYITEVIELEAAYIQVVAGVVTAAQCRRDGPEGATFTGFLTEPYARHETLHEPYAVNMLRMVLVTSKAVELLPGKLVQVDGTAWPVQTAHTLDGVKNEYELERTVDL